MTTSTKTDRRHTTGKCSAGSQPAIILDAVKYRTEIADLGLTTDQEREYIETVWAILLQAMQLGIRLEFEAESCGQDGETRPLPPIPDAGGVELENKNFHSNFKTAVRQADAAAAEGGGS